jgi:hypothetical protein
MLQQSLNRASLHWLSSNGELIFLSWEIYTELAIFTDGNIIDHALPYIPDQRQRSNCQDNILD